MTEKRRGTLSLGQAVPVSAGELPGEPVGQPQPQPQPLPGPTQPAEPDERDESDFASKQASRGPGRPDALSTTRERVKRAGGDAIDVSLLIAGPPDPDADLVTVSMRIPRYLSQALTLTSTTSRRPVQAIVADMLRAHLDGERVAQVRRALYP
jgi:hypothetical protein